MKGGSGGPPIKEGQYDEQVDDLRERMRLLRECCFHSLPTSACHRLDDAHCITFRISTEARCCPDAYVSFAMIVSPIRSLLQYSVTSRSIVSAVQIQYTPYCSSNTQYQPDGSDFLVGGRERPRREPAHPGGE
jgi:hypothetical protein